MKKTFFSLLFFFLVGLLSAQWITNNEYGFKINIPNGWTQDSKMDGGDKVYDLIDPSQNVFIEVRAFKPEVTVNADQIAEVFESQYLSSANRMAFENYTLNNTPGKFGGYTMNVEGLDVVVATFYATANGIGYVLWTMVETRLYEQYSAVGDAVLNTFTTFSPSSNSNAMVAKPIFKITNMKLGKKLTADYNINPQDESVLFDPQQQEIFVIWDWEGKAAGKTMSIKWYYNGQEITKASKFYKLPQNNQGYGWASIQKPANGFKSGSYYVQIDFEGKKQRSIDFEISKPASNQNSGFVITPPGGSGKDLKPNAEASNGWGNASGGSSQSSASSSSEAEKIVLISGGLKSCYSFKTGKIHNNHQEADMILEPWCTEQPGVCGNWVLTGKSSLSQVSSPPASGYISDEAGFTDCQILPLNNVAVFKLKDGSYAKVIIQNTNFSNSQSQNPPCQHKATILVEYPAF